MIDLRNAVNGFGKDTAAFCCLFVAAYSIIKDERGTRVEGGSPDGRCTGTCDRCGMAIMNVYVFATRDGSTTMHVGCDCAANMGVPVEEIRKGQRAMRSMLREVATRADRLAVAERLATRRAIEAAERQMRLDEAAELVAEIDRLRTDVRATDWERNTLGRMISKIGAEGHEWFTDSDDEWATEARGHFFAIRTRLALCDTSGRTVALPADGTKAISGTFRAYRDPIVLPPYGYGRGYTFVNFLCDDEGRAFVWKGGRSCQIGTAIRGTFSPEDGVDERDGLISKRVLRPRKAVFVLATGEEVQF